MATVATSIPTTSPIIATGAANSLKATTLGLCGTLLVALFL